MESVTRTIAPALRRGALALLAAVLGAMALAGCGANGTSDSSGAYEKTNYLTDEAANQRAVDALESVGASLEESGDPTFAGAWIDSSGVIFNVVGHPSTTVGAAISTVQQKVSVEMRVVSYSLAHLQRRTEEISADEQAWANEGLKITAVGPDIPHNRVVVSFSTADIPTAARRTFLQAYGPETTIGPPSVAAGS